MKSASTVDNSVLTYEFLTKDKKVVSISIEDSEENPKFKIHGPKEIIAEVIGGLGGENDIEAWATEKELDTESKRMFAVLEIITILQSK